MRRKFMKLLIVEDNHLLAASLKDQCKTHYIVDVARTGSQALELATSTTYGLIVLDLGLPDISGRSVCQRLREQGITTPILVATGVKDPEECIHLLDDGADDYITKPYNGEVLLARLRALGRRGPTAKFDQSLTIDDLIINTQSRQVTRGNIPITLRKKEYDILEYLVQNRGRAVTRAMILNHVWETGKESWNNTVDVHIKYLRDKIDKPFDKPLIKTAYGIGYMVDTSG